MLSDTVYNRFLKKVAGIIVLLESFRVFSKNKEMAEKGENRAPNWKWRSKHWITDQPGNDASNPAMKLILLAKWNMSHEVWNSTVSMTWYYDYETANKDKRFTVWGGNNTINLIWYRWFNVHYA